MGLVTFALLAFAGPTAKGDDLGKIFTDTGWDKLVGTWVNEDASNETTFSWKYAGRVFQSITKMGQNETTTLICRNPVSGVTYVYSAGSHGGSSSGTATFEKGKAVFEITAATPDGKDVKMEITYWLTDADTLEVKVGDTGIKLKRK